MCWWRRFVTCQFEHAVALDYFVIWVDDQQHVAVRYIAEEVRYCSHNAIVTNRQLRHAKNVELSGRDPF